MSPIPWKKTHDGFDYSNLYLIFRNRDITWLTCEPCKFVVIKIIEKLPVKQKIKEFCLKHGQKVFGQRYEFVCEKLDEVVNKIVMYAKKYAATKGAEGTCKLIKMCPKPEF